MKYCYNFILFKQKRYSDNIIFSQEYQDNYFNKLRRVSPKVSINCIHETVSVYVTRIRLLRRNLINLI